MSRDSNRTSFRAFREIVGLIIELIRQFYSEAHVFRILNEETGENFYLEMDNAGMKTERGNVIFDLEITTERNSSYTRMAQNELMLSFFNSKFFDPNIADQALACLQMMDFEGKEELIQMIGQNYRVNELMQSITGYAQTLAAEYDKLAAAVGIESNEAANAQAMAAQVSGAVSGGAPGAEAKIPEAVGESAVTKKAREGAAAAASPV
jgi:hypothetical protein